MVDHDRTGRLLRVDLMVLGQTAADAFGLKETDLFQPSHLYDYTDFARVLHTLSKVNINLFN